MEQPQSSSLSSPSSENTKFFVKPLDFGDRIDEAVKNALLDLKQVPLTLSNQPIILACHDAEGLSTNIAFWPSTMDIGRRVVKTIENYEHTASVQISYNLLMIALKKNSIEYQRNLLEYFKLNTISELGMLIDINDGQPAEECFRRDITMPVILLESLHSHLYIIKCYIFS